MSERVRGGKHGLKGYRRELLSPFSEAEKRLKQLPNPSPEETATFHGLHRLFAYATELKQGIWDVRSSEDLARAAGLEWLIASIRSSGSRGTDNPSADSIGRSRSPPVFPDPSVEVAASSSSTAGPRPSSRIYQGSSQRRIHLGCRSSNCSFHCAAPRKLHRADVRDRGQL